MIDIFGYNFINIMKTIVPTCKVASGGKEVVIRCPYCGDSKMLNHAHFYISVPVDNTDLSMFHCKKCNVKGILDDDLLRRIGCNNNNLILDIMRRNDYILKLPKYKTIKNINVYPLSNKYISNRNTNEFKLSYINNRIGANYSYEDILKLKIFLNLYDVVNSNKLELTRYQDICTTLDKYFLGFISYDNSYCSLRKLTEKDLYQSINKRYIIYNLVNKIDNKKNFYVIPTNLDILSINPIKIHIAEGQFDILSVYHNLNNDNNLNNVYIACSGKGYSKAVEFILLETGIINYEIHYYPDNDVDDNELMRNIKNVLNLPCSIYVHRNIYDDEKDFGVSKDRIKEVVKCIKKI